MTTATITESITPLLVYEDIEAAHDYLVNVLGLTPIMIQRRPDGVIMHGEVAHGDNVIWLHGVTAGHELQPPYRLSATHAGLNLQVPDVDEHYARTSAAGAPIDEPPTTSPFGFRMYGTRDPEGHRWWFYTPTS